MKPFPTIYAKPDQSTATLSPQPLDLRHLEIRWLIRRRMPEVLAIEAACFTTPWTKPWGEDEFIRSLRQRNVIGMTASDLGNNDTIAGYMIYELHHGHLDIINLAVAPAYQRQRVGSTMIAKLLSKLSPERRNRLRFGVSEHNLDMHLFLRAVGARAGRVLRDQYEDNPSDTYEFLISIAD